MLRNRRTQQGFSLVEVAIVLVIIGVLLAGITGPLSTWRDHETYKQTELYLEQSRKALLTFAAIKGYLPCPDTDGDGSENRPSDHCQDTNGTLPYLDLGLPKEMPWGGAAVYIVHDKANTPCDGPKVEAQCFFSTDKFGFQTQVGATDSFTVKDDEAHELVTQALAVIASYGQNSAATFSNCNAGSDSADEKENCDKDDTFIHTTHRTAPGNSYDDQLIWLDKLSLHGLLLAN